MDRLKTLGTWVLLVILFFIFTNIIIHIITSNGSLKKQENNTAYQTENETLESAI